MLKTGRTRQEGAQMLLKDKVAIVTGGSRGIGRAICLDFAANGATVYACARHADKLAEVRDQARQQEWAGTILPTTLDVTDRAAIDAVVEAAAEQHGRIDILVNNAGITRDGLVMSMDDEQFDIVLDTNLRATFWMTRATARHMVRARWGRMINISSVSGVMGNAGQANYAASKAAVIGFTKSVAKELGKRKITCNAIAPGFVVTEMTDVLADRVKEGAQQLIPLGRFGEPAEVAAATTFLASDAAAYITGQVLVVDGGLHM